MSSFLSSFYILNISPLLGVELVKIFSLSVAAIFQMMVPFARSSFSVSRGFMPRFCYPAFGWMAVFTILILPIYKHGDLSIIWYFLKFLYFMSYISFVRVTPDIILRPLWNTLFLWFLSQSISNS